jgi:hypothetical protein
MNFLERNVSPNTIDLTDDYTSSTDIQHNDRNKVLDVLIHSIREASKLEIVI